MTVPVAFWEGLGVGLLVSAAAAALLWWALRQRLKGGSLRAEVSAPRAHPSAPALDPARLAAATVNPAAAARPVAAGANGPVVAAATPPVLHVPAPAPIRSEPGQLRLSHRVLLHLSSQGRIGPDEIPPKALTQAGMVEILAVNQGALTGVLRRLVAAGVLDERREHVRGADRRLKVYRLTDAGADLCRELRGRRPP